MNQDSYLIDKEVCREVYIILNKLNLYSRIPKELKIYLEENQNMEHKFDFNENYPLFFQITNDDTKSFLTYLFIKYLNTNKTDAEYCKNEIIEIMRNEGLQNL